MASYKILLVNGSPKPKGCVARAFDEIEKVLHENGVDTERVEIGTKDIRGCIGCNFCVSHGRCVFNDAVNEFAPKLAEADGMIVGTPTYYAGANGQALAFLDRLFYSSAKTVDKTMKVGAAVESCRRAGSTSAFDEINKYFSMYSMPIVTSTYWNGVHGFTAEDVEQDLEGLQTMRNLARNMAFMVKAIRAQKEAEGLPLQEHEAFTSFSNISSDEHRGG